MKHFLILPSLLSVLSLFAPFVHAAESPLRVGLAVVEITPPVGWRKGGGLAEIISTGVHDPLFAKAIVFAQGEAMAALVVCDLLGLPEFVSTPTRREILQRTGIPSAHVSLTATHNHGGPEYYGPMRNLFHERALAEHGRDPHEPFDYSALLQDRIAQAVADARAKVVPVTMEILRATQSGLAFNRRYHMQDGTVRFNPGKLNPKIERVAGPTDPDLPFLLFRRIADGKPIGALSLFAMHVAVFGSAEFGADFPAHLERRLRAHFGPEFISVFGEGCAGDVNHFNTATRDPDPTPEAIGDRLGTTILNALEAARPTGRANLAVRSTIIQAPLLDVTAEQIARAKALMARTGRQPLEFLLQVDAWRVLHNEAYRRRFGATLPNEIQVFRLADDVAVVTLPHEVFVELGLEIKRRSPFRHTLVITLAHDVDFYVPTARAHAEGGYEVITTPLKVGAGELFVEGAVALLKSLAP